MADNTALTLRGLELIRQVIILDFIEQFTIADLPNFLGPFQLDSDKYPHIALGETANILRSSTKPPEFTHESPAKSWLLIGFRHPAAGASDLWPRPRGVSEPLHIGKQHIQIMESAQSPQNDAFKADSDCKNTPCTRVNIGLSQFRLTPSTSRPPRAAHGLKNLPCA